MINQSVPEQQATQKSQPLQSTSLSNAGMGQANAAPVNTPVSLPLQVEIPRGPVVWLYQDNNEQPQPLARDENMMDMDMPDVSAAGALSERPCNPINTCTCTRTSPPNGSTRGLGASRWAVGGIKVDDNCPEHGNRASPFWGNNNIDSSDTRAAAENLPEPRVWYYQ